MKKYLLAIVGFVITLLSALFMARKSGKDSAQKEQLEDSLKQSKTANEIRSKNRDASDADVRRRLSKYERK